MSLLGEHSLVDGRPTHQILAIQQRRDAMIIVVAPRRVSLTATLVGAGLIIVGAFVLFLLSALCVVTFNEVPLAVRWIQGGLIAFWFLVLAGFLVVQLRFRLNYRTIEVEAGMITMATGPIWPGSQALQLHVGDAIGVSHRQRRSLLAWLSLQRRESNDEYCICVCGKQPQGDRDVEIIPPFTLSLHEAGKLAGQMQKTAAPADRPALDGSRL